jgi:hypothetical protein
MITTKSEALILLECGCTLEHIRGTDIWRMWSTTAGHPAYDIDASPGRSLVRRSDVQPEPDILWWVSCRSWKMKR